MLVLRPYSLPINPGKRQIDNLLGEKGFLLGTEHWKSDGGRDITLKRWVQEKPQYEELPFGAFAILRVFIHYVNEDPVSDFNIRLGTTNVRWEPHRLSRIVTLWAPLSTNTRTRFLLSVGNIEESDVGLLLAELIPGAQPDQIKGAVFDFQEVRRKNPKGWMHGCENRPGTIQKGTLYGDFTFSTHSELDGFMDSAAGTKSNQEGITLNGSQKIRVLKLGKFQLMGIAAKDFFNAAKRSDVMERCFNVAQRLL